MFLTKINGDKANNSKWGNITYFYNSIIILGVDFWEFEKVNGFLLFNWSFFGWIFMLLFIWSIRDYFSFLTNKSSWRCWPQHRKKQSQNASHVFPLWLLWRHPASHRERVKSCLWAPYSKELLATPILKETRQDGLPRWITDLVFYMYFPIKIIRMMCNIYIMAQ